MTTSVSARRPVVTVAVSVFNKQATVKFQFRSRKLTVTQRGKSNAEALKAAFSIGLSKFRCETTMQVRVTRGQLSLFKAGDCLVSTKTGLRHQVQWVR